MTLGLGWGMFVFGTTATVLGFFIAFLVINYNAKKKKDKVDEEVA